MLHALPYLQAGWWDHNLCPEGLPPQWRCSSCRASIVRNELPHMWCLVFLPWGSARPSDLWPQLQAWMRCPQQWLRMWSSPWSSCPSAWLCSRYAQQVAGWWCTFAPYSNVVCLWAKSRTQHSSPQIPHYSLLSTDLCFCMEKTGQITVP